LCQRPPCGPPPRQIVAIGTIAYVGTTAASSCAPGRTRPRSTPTVAAGPSACAGSAAHAYTAEHQRIRVRSEDKDAIAAFHWRGAPDEAAAAAAVGGIARRALQEGLAVHWGRKVLEVRPPVGPRQGSRHRCAAGAGNRLPPPLYVGDDTTDLDAFPRTCALRFEQVPGALEHGHPRGGQPMN